MRKIRKACIALVMGLLPLISMGQSRTWEIGLAGGAVYNFKTPLRIQQKDLPTLRLDADYKTEPFNPPVYYDIRVSNWKEAKGLELKFTHHKLILENRPPEVQRFSITNGYNLLTLNRLWLIKGVVGSVGGGVVITHPESTIRGKAFPENRGLFNDGYYVSGPVAEAALQKRYYFAGRWFILGEGRATASYVKVPVVDGKARVTNVALHALLGFGFKLNDEIR